jgi:hypothetical protein
MSPLVIQGKRYQSRLVSYFLFLFPPEGMLNAMRRRPDVLNFTLGRLRRFIRKPVVLWFAEIVFSLLVTMMLMILLLNTDVKAVDDLLADFPLDTTGARNISGFFRLTWPQIAIIGHIYNLDLDMRSLAKAYCFFPLQSSSPSQR